MWVIDVSQAVPREYPLALRFLIRDCAAINRFFAKSWQMSDVPSDQALFNQVTNFNFGKPDEFEPHVPTDPVLFAEELEAAVLELQRKNNVQRNQFSANLRTGREDDYHEEDAEDYQNDDFYEFLNHLSDLNAKNASKVECHSSGEESFLTDDEEAGPS